MEKMATDEHTNIFERLRYKRGQFMSFGYTYDENLIWDSYIHGESIENEDIIIVA